MEGVNDVTEVPITQQFGEATIVDLPHIGPRQNIDVKDLEEVAKDVKQGDIVFLRTGYSDRYRKPQPNQEYYDDSPGLTLSAAEWLVRKKIKVLGADIRTFEPFPPNRKMDVTGFLHSNGILTIEDLVNLGQIKKQRSFVVCGLPLKIRGLKGGPARVVAIGGEEDRRAVVDCTHALNTYPEPEWTVEPPIPEHIEPVELRLEVVKWCELIPFTIAGELTQVRGPRETGEYIRFSQEFISHAEFSFLEAYCAHSAWKVDKELCAKYHRMPLEKMIGEAAIVKLKIGPKQLINANQLDAAGRHVKEGDIVLLKTGYDDLYFHTQYNLDNTPGLSESAAEWLVDRGVATVAVDFPSVEVQAPSAGGHLTAATHCHLFSHNIPIVEYLCNTRMLRKDRAFVTFLPLPVRGIQPVVRAVVFEEWN